MRQQDLASSTGLTQARVSQLLSAWRRDGVVAGTRAAWRVADRVAAMDLWLANYPGPGGTTTHWAGLDGMWAATLSVLDELPEGSIVSGDAGADLLAAWRRPTRAVLYARELPDLSAAGVVPVPGASEASVSVVVPADPSVWPVTPLTRPFQGRQLAVADPLQVLWDIMRRGGLDSGQAVDHLRSWIELAHAAEPRAAR